MHMMVPIALSAAFRAGSCQDIVEEIFPWTPSYSNSNRYSWRGSLQSLACCARVNHMFHDTAVKFLWEELYDWKPLLYVLYKSVSMRRHSGEADLYGPIDDDQWARMVFHASFVRRIIRLDEVSASFGPAFWALIIYARGKPIFPNLRRIDHITIDHTRLGALNLIPPTLSAVVISLHQKGADGCHAGNLNAAGVVLLMQAPSLTSLSIKFTFSPHDVNPEDLRSLAAFRCLEHLDIACSSAKTSWPPIHGLCLVLPRLRSLGVAFDNYERSYEHPEEAILQGNPPLENLTHLHVRGYQADASVILHSVANSALHTLYLEGSLSSEEGLRALDNVVSLFSSSLKRIFIRCLYVSEGQASDIIPFSRFAERITGLIQLEDLLFGRALAHAWAPAWDVRFDYDDGGESLYRLASTLPHLRKLDILPQIRVTDRLPSPLQTLRTIEAFAASRPDMEILCLPVDYHSTFESWNGFTSDVEPRLSMSRVALLDVKREPGLAEIRDRLSEYVTQIYPQVTQVEFVEIRDFYRENDDGLLADD